VRGQAGSIALVQHTAKDAGTVTSSSLVFAANDLPVRDAARRLVSVNTYQKARRAVCQQTPAMGLEKRAQIVGALTANRPYRQSVVC
jgi:hypothetical protein